MLNGFTSQFDDQRHHRCLWAFGNATNGGKIYLEHHWIDHQPQQNSNRHVHCEPLPNPACSVLRSAGQQFSERHAHHHADEHPHSQVALKARRLGSGAGAEASGADCVFIANVGVSQPSNLLVFDGFAHHSIVRQLFRLHLSLFGALGKIPEQQRRRRARKRRATLRVGLVAERDDVIKCPTDLKLKTDCVCFLEMSMSTSRMTAITAGFTKPGSINFRPKSFAPPFSSATPPPSGYGRCWTQKKDSWAFQEKLFYRDRVSVEGVAPG